MERTYTHTSGSKYSVFIKIGTDRRHTSCVVNAKPDSWKKNYKRRVDFETTAASRYLEFQGTHWNTSIYPYLDISDLRNWGKQ